jgi:hypothetical protein
MFLFNQLDEAKFYEIFKSTQTLYETVNMYISMANYNWTQILKKVLSFANMDYIYQAIDEKNIKSCKSE